VSRDGRRVVYNPRNAQWTLDLATGARARVLSDAATWHGGWLPGDQRMAVRSNTTGDWDLLRQAGDARTDHGDDCCEEEARLEKRSDCQTSGDAGGQADDNSDGTGPPVIASFDAGQGCRSLGQECITARDLSS
jgi:hypothetical protein